MVMVSGVGALFVRVLPTDWVARSEVIAITLFSLAMVLLLGGGLTLIQVAGGLKIPRKLTPDERAIVREAVGDVIDQLPTKTVYPTGYEA